MSRAFAARILALLLAIVIPVTWPAEVAVQNRSNKPIWVACGYNGSSQGGFANDFQSFDDFVGGYTIAPGETKTIVSSNEVYTVWLHISANNQSYIPAGAASFKLDKSSIIQHNRANPKRTEWIYMVPEFAKLSTGGSSIQKGDTAQTLDGQTLTKFPAGRQVTVSRPGTIPNTVSQRGSLAFFKIDPRGTYVFQGAPAGPKPVNPQPKPPVQPANPPPGKPNPGKNTVAVPFTVKVKNAHNKRAIFTLKSDNGPGMATSLDAGAAKTFSLLGAPGITPTIVIQQPGGGVLSFTIAANGDYVIRLDGGKLKNFYNK